MSFSQKFTLKLHKKKKHTYQKRKYKCSACDKTFIQREDLKKHKVRTHIGKQPFKCQKCDVRFSKQRDLEKHIESVHIGIKLCCPLCNADFTNNNDLIKHNVLVHEGLKQRDSGMDFYHASPPENSLKVALFWCPWPGPELAIKKTNHKSAKRSRSRRKNVP